MRPLFKKETDSEELGKPQDDLSFTDMLGKTVHWVLISLMIDRTFCAKDSAESFLCFDNNTVWKRL